MESSISHYKEFKVTKHKMVQMKLFIVMTNSAYPDKMTQYVASHLDLHSLFMSHFGSARHKWVLLKF